MDLYCQRCGEPWDMDHVNFEMDPQEKVAFKTGEFCPACRGRVIKKRPLRAELAGVLSSMLGDDEDGIAVEMEDAELLYGEEFWE